ncbi:hypothetical protein FRAHR75_370023 [Frankia sp. Hr75.2]|nr:hypothetical protein FRAHR75_370023 [Frankia sp. Hr75.2]
MPGVPTVGGVPAPGPHPLPGTMITHANHAYPTPELPEVDTERCRDLVPRRC